VTGVRWWALGCEVHVVTRDPAAATTAAQVLQHRLEELDAACSRFRDSELTRLRPGRQRVGPVLAGAIRVALDAAHTTRGLVDPTLGAAMREVGYDRTFSELPTDAPESDRAGRPQGRWLDVSLDGDVLDLPDVELDLGATAKAWAADCAAEEIGARFGDVVVSLGGDVAAIGAWPVEVGDPGEPTEVVEVSGGLATSSTLRRTWRRGGRHQHHLLDPRSGLPARPHWRTVTVAATTCVEANTASTAAVVLGPEAPAWLGDRPARLVDQEQSLTTTGGWPR
jgi:thiamine biosynthesis lipoprotein